MRKITLTVLMLVAIIIVTPLIVTVKSEPQTIVIRRETSSGSGIWYTQTNIILGGANNTIKIPDNWNGGLIMLCRGYSASVDNPYASASKFNPNTIPMDQFVNLIVRGYATAASNYGEGGMCIKEAMIHTHQLTEYVINNYGVTGKVYLVGISMGGNVVLQLGAKYPDIYDGVFDMCGVKNYISQYEDRMFYLSLATDAALSAELLARGCVVPPYPTPTVALFRAFCKYSAYDIWVACGNNTPAEKPKAYERISPIYSAIDITVPTITVQGTADALVPYSSSVAFMNAVTDAGYSDMYRFYKVVGGQHSDMLLINQAMGVRFWQLVAWVENGVLPPSSDPA